MRSKLWMTWGFFCALSAGTWAGDFFSFHEAYTAREIELVKANSDAFPEDNFIRADVDDSGVMIASRFVRPEGTMPIPFEKLPEGVVLLKMDKYEVIKLISKDFSPKNGGHFTIDYLYNAINGSRKKFEMDLVRNGTQWTLEVNETSGRRPFKEVFIKSNKVFGQTVGVKEIIAKKIGIKLPFLEIE